ncbi:probable ATP-dependent RNA helicase Dbp45A [Hyalella azteca]|uniref:Probable ATP-dependent RNA helicase Dbp45A n=1 Tax=Hyalella azteca TaxID=294128 RepID=A0A979FK56_HYAAZ|nr:probable ATP-dependent RNA helicase Dbp45A [Hyalella azteca]
MPMKEVMVMDKVMVMKVMVMKRVVMKVMAMKVMVVMAPPSVRTGHAPGRGLDIPQVSLVVNHRMPNCSKTYIHRVGRTARAGRGGTALTILTPEDQHLLLALEARNPCKLVNYKTDSVLVRRLLKQVNATRRGAELRLEEGGSLRRSYTGGSSCIARGLDPDEECRLLEERIRRGQQRRRLRFLKAHGELGPVAHGDQSHGDDLLGLTAKAKEKAIIKRRPKVLAKDLKDEDKNQKVKARCGLNGQNLQARSGFNGQNFEASSGLKGQNLQAKSGLDGQNLKARSSLKGQKVKAKIDLKKKNVKSNLKRKRTEV